MLVSCQVCQSNVSDQAAACPKCGTEKPAFLGPESYCYECGASIRTAYQSCGSCGAPRSREAKGNEVDSLATEKQADQIEPVLQAAEREPPHRYETAKPKDKGGVGRFVGGLVSTVVAIVVGIFVSGFVREMFSEQRAQKETVTLAELEEFLAGTDEGRLFEFIKTEMPDDYSVMMNRLVGFMNTSEEFSSEKAANDAGFAQGGEAMNALLEANWVHLQTAPDAELIRLGLATESLYARLKTLDTALCASFAKGSIRTMEDQIKLKEYGIDMVNLQILTVAAISSGKRHNTFRTLATDSDWQEIFERTYPALRPETYEEYLNTDDLMQMTDQALCDFESALITEMMRESPERQAMWIATINDDGELPTP